MWLFVLVLVLILVKTYLPLIFWRKRPPGPPILPFVGSLISLAKADPESQKYPFRAIHRLSQIHGSVMTIGLGPENWVILSGMDAIKKFAMSDAAVARPDMGSLSDIYSFGIPLGVIFPDGPLWREQRKFMMKTLREFGMGKQSMEEHILEEVNFCANYLAKKCVEHSSEIPEMQNFFNLPCLNVIWRLVCGKRFEYEDQKMKELIAMIDSFTMESAIGPIAGVKPLKYISPFKEIYQNVKGQMNTFKSFMRDFVEEQKSSLNQQDFDRGYIDSFLKAQNRQDGRFFTDEQLIISVQDFFTGGSGTMSKTLAFAILFAMKHPEVQEKIQDEVDLVIQEKSEQDKHITIADRLKIPFTEATVLEVQRLSSVLAIAPPRVATQDVNLGEFVIKKGTQVQMSLYSLHRNKQHWKDPENFRPQRFLSQDGLAVEQDDWLQPFGYGKRKCLGENVARNTVILFLANLLHKFKFSTKHSDKLDSEPEGGLTIGPKDFSAKVEIRTQHC